MTHFQSEQSFISVALYELSINHTGAGGSLAELVKHFDRLTFLFLVDIYAAHYNLGRYTMDVLNLILLSVGGICLALALFILSLDPPPRQPGEEKRKTRQS